ncbi:MAG: CoA-binding protein [Bacteroidetes bacterium]|nr:CoA-binding protein [Bacteroidota bacterium]
MKNTLIIGASNNPDRYAYRAAHMLKNTGHPIIPFGVKRGEVAGQKILNAFPKDADIDTITLYINPRLQEQYYQQILELHPKRIIFNPGTENDELRDLAEEAGIETEYACTLVLLSSGQY